MNARAVTTRLRRRCCSACSGSSRRRLTPHPYDKRVVNQDKESSDKSGRIERFRLGPNTLVPKRQVAYSLSCSRNPNGNSTDNGRKQCWHFSAYVLASSASLSLSRASALAASRIAALALAASKAAFLGHLLTRLILRALPKCIASLRRRFRWTVRSCFRSPLTSMLEGSPSRFQNRRGR